MDTVAATQAEAHLSPQALENVRTWLEKPKYTEYRAELVTLLEAGRWQELEDSFFKVIEFGTAGRRGTTGIGSNRINRVTIGESAAALSQYIKNLDPAATEKGIVIAYDTRLSSPELSRYVATVCAASGFMTYVFESYRSTPELSFAVRELGCAAGIVISASHNPPADNGFKAYWNDGCQVNAPHDTGILAVAAQLETIPTLDYDTAVAEGKISLLGEAIDEKYLAATVAQAEGTERNLTIAYSPLHGAGQRNTLPTLRAAGFRDIAVVEEQMVPDGNFPTIPSGRPNPEDPPANELVVKKMLAVDADIAITNDPDADRMGVMVNHHGAVKYLNGNQSGSLATAYVLAAKRQNGTLSPGAYIAKTIVTTDLMAAIAERYQVRCYGHLLVGFKYIGELIRSKEGTDEHFVLAVEESFGALKGDYARDKDGATGSLALAEYAAELKAQGKTLWDALFDLFREYGVYAERLVNMMSPGARGFETMQAIMNRIRTAPPAAVDGHAVTAVIDYQALTRRDLNTNEVTPLDSPASNVVVLEFDAQPARRITVRPSGTEPKIKLYVQWHDAPLDDVEAQYAALDTRLESIARSLEKDLTAGLV